MAAAITTSASLRPIANPTGPKSTAHVKDCILPWRIRTRLDKMISKRVIHNLIFHGSYGIGKTASAIALCHDVGSDPCLANGSLENGVDDLRKLEPFVCTRNFDGSRKVVLIDDADRL